MELSLYENAKSYIDEVLNGRTKIPTTSWKKERENLIAERKYLNQEYQHLKNEINEVERIRRGVYDIVQVEKFREKPL